MTALALEEPISVAFPRDIAAFLNRRAERDRLSIPQTLTVILAGVMEEDDLEEDLPQWEKDFIDQRLEIVQRHPERLVDHISFETQKTLGDFFGMLPENEHRPLKEQAAKARKEWDRNF